MRGQSAGTASSTTTGDGTGEGSATAAEGRPEPRPTLGGTMSTLSERLNRGAATAPSQVDHARRLVADWQLLADLAFADLTLWVPLRTGAWWCVAQVGPLTAPASQPEDLVGSEADGPDADPFRLAHREGRPVTEGDPDWSGS